MEKSAVREYFNRLAPNWDATACRSEDAICAILDAADIRAGQRILDVACGTGVLIPDYLKRSARSVTGVDISENMIAEARKKYPHGDAEFICADAETLSLSEPFDRIMVYNAIPHFPDPDSLIRSLCKMLTRGGILTVAHGMSREAINAHHSGSARDVSLGLPPAQELAGIFERYLSGVRFCSDASKYYVCGEKA